jgi:coproporphyrinogen III oxidase-like Fe-S oxidoreductase
MSIGGLRDIVDPLNLILTWLLAERGGTKEQSMTPESGFPGALVSATETMLQIDAAVRSVKEKDLLVYIHVPFCNSKCVFCDWVADVPVRDLVAASKLSGEYVKALCRQMRSFGPRLSEMGYTARYIYWGGGTPSRLTAQQISDVASALSESFDLSHIEQHMMETSPDTLTKEKLEMMRSIGITRLSTGVQSFDDTELRRAARSHSAKQAEEAAAMIAGVFDDFNIDLIAALPGQKLEMLEHSVNKTIGTGAPHISVYVYRPDTRTVMTKQSAGGDREIITHTKMIEFYDRAKEILEAAGYEEYTTFYFAKSPGYRFKGEMYYFELIGDYVGFGSGAYSILGHRFLKNSANVHSFIANPFDFEHCEVFSPRRPEQHISILLAEAVLTNAGINFENFERIAGFPFSVIRYNPYIQSLMQYYMDCGAQFIETDESLSVTPETRSKAHIAHLAGIYEAARVRLAG